MLRKEVFEIWCPYGADWVGWIKPVAFMNIISFTVRENHTNLTIPKLDYPYEYQSETAFIIDLPNYEALPYGLAFAEIGYRPIPVYNGTDPQTGVMPIVDNSGKDIALSWGAQQLLKMKLSLTASPVFLLDSNRTHRFRINPGVFDNSWDVYDQDLPSAAYFLRHNVKAIIIFSEKIQKDLAKILYKYQKKNIKIYFTKGEAKPKKIHIRKQPT